MIGGDDSLINYFPEGLSQFVLCILWGLSCEHVRQGVWRGLGIWCKFQSMLPVVLNEAGYAHFSDTMLGKSAVV